MVAEVKKEDNVILIGKKPIMSYILAVITQFGAGQKEVKIRARGRAISRAVDVANIVRKRYVKDAQIKSITIDSEERDNPQTGKKVNVSTIEIVLSK
ncbi:MAG: DNA-binding protein Alba [Candidatus Aenigmatarchaeota archaeon]